MKTIYLVTGAAGFMGTNVCAQLLERGNAVRAFVLNGDPAVKFMPKAVEIFEGDLCSPEDCEKFFAVEPGHPDRLHPLREHGDDQPELQ